MRENYLNKTTLFSPSSKIRKGNWDRASILAASTTFCTFKLKLSRFFFYWFFISLFFNRLFGFFWFFWFFCFLFVDIIIYTFIMKTRKNKRKKLLSKRNYCFIVIIIVRKKSIKTKSLLTSTNGNKYVKPINLTEIFYW